MNIELSMTNELKNMINIHDIDRDRYLNENFIIFFDNDVSNELMSDVIVKAGYNLLGYGDDIKLSFDIDNIISRPIYFNYINYELFDITHIASYCIPNSIVIRKKTYFELCETLKSSKILYVNPDIHSRQVFYLSKGKYTDLIPIYGVYDANIINLSDKVNSEDVTSSLKNTLYSIVYDNDNEIKILLTGTLSDFINDGIIRDIYGYNRLQDISIYSENNELFYNLPELTSAVLPVSAMMIPTSLINIMVSKFEYDEWR